MNLYFELLNSSSACSTLYWQYILQVLMLVVFISIFITRNNLYSLVFMVLMYLLVFPIFIWIQLDFIGAVFIMVYVGAVAILFLFVLMTIDVKKMASKPSYNRHIVTYKEFFAASVYFLFIFIVCCSLFENSEILNLERLYDLGHIYYTSLSEFNVNNLGFLLYEFYFVELLLFGLLLLVALIGSVIFFRKVK